MLLKGEILLPQLRNQKVGLVFGDYAHKLISLGAGGADGLENDAPNYIRAPQFTFLISKLGTLSLTLYHPLLP
jgi:hypothetical protein